MGDSKNSAAETLLNDLQNPFATQSQTTSIYVALGLSLGSLAVIAILFSLLRPHHNAIYAPKLKHADKKHAPPRIGNGVFAWVDPIVKTKEMDMVDKIGMDGTIFLRFTRMLRNIFILLSLFGCGILIPVHLLYTDKPNSADQSHKRQAPNGQPQDAATDYLFKLTPQTVYGSPMWAHVVFAYIADIIICYFLWRNYRAVARLRRAYFETPEYQNSVHGRSLMVTDVPPPNRTDEGIFKLVDAATQVHSIPKTAIGRNMKELPEMLEEHEETVRKLEEVLAKYLKDPNKLPPKRPEMRAPGKARGKVDAIDYLTSRIQELEIRIKDTRETIDKRNPEPYGFATYESISDAHQVAWASKGKHPKGATIILSPTPKDIIWKNLRLSKRARGGKLFTANLYVALLTGLYIVPNAFIAIFLANFSNLASIWPAFEQSYQANNKTWGAVQAILSPAIFSLFYLFLPSIFRRISEHAGDQTKTQRERHVIHKLYAFFVFNNLIVFSIFSALWAFIARIVKDQNGGFTGNVWDDIKTSGQELANTLLASLCQLSPFWIAWLLQRNIGAAIDLAQLVNMVFQWFRRHLMAPTPREIIEATAPPPFDYASYYNYFLYYATVATCYSTIQPLVLPITLLYFALDAWLKKYLLLYVFITKTESGGMFWNVLHNRMLFATLLQNVVGAVVIKAAWGTWTMLACMAPLPFLLLGFKIWVAKTYANQVRYYTKAIMHKASDVEAMTDPKKKIKHVSSRLTNPVMTKPLMTPMVHAKAQHMLAQVYRGRLDDDGTRGGYDVPMSDMHAGLPGRKAPGDIADMFEVVNETDLDFENFKNRAEFKDQFGGGGELYGRPADLPDRSATPASFMTSDAGSDGSLTRAGTPEPMPGLVHPAFRNQQGPGPYGYNPAQDYGMRAGIPGQHYRDGSVGSDNGVPRAGFYRQPAGTGSAHRLVNDAQPMGYVGPGSEHATPSEELPEQQAFGLDRWRHGGAGYTPVLGGDLGESNYDNYRRPGRF